MLSSSPASSPSLSVRLHDTFDTLSGGAKRMFKRQYMHLWKNVVDYEKFDVVSYGYAVNAVVWNMKEINMPEFWMLARLWILSLGATNTINGINHSFSKNDYIIMKRFLDRSWILRTSFDPLHPNHVKPHSLHRTYISLTPAAIKVYNVVVRKIYNYVIDDCANALYNQKKDPNRYPFES